MPQVIQQQTYWANGSPRSSEHVIAIDGDQFVYVVMETSTAPSRMMRGDYRHLDRVFAVRKDAEKYVADREKQEKNDAKCSADPFRQSYSWKIETRIVLP